MLIRFAKSTALMLVMTPLLLEGFIDKESAPEYEVKGAYLYNFAKFVQWPRAASQSENTIVIGILGKDPFGPLLEQILDGKTANEKTFVIKRAARVDDLADCHMVFISAANEKFLKEALKALQRASILTIGDSSDFTRLGGMISLQLEQNKIHFVVNLDAVERSGITISSRALQLARIVRQPRETKPQ